MFLIDIENLRVRRGSKTICSVPQFVVERGERFGVFGKNGSGKTTLLRVIAGLERRFAGRCSLDVRKKQIVFVAQSVFLFRGTVLFNVMYGLRAHGLGHTLAESRALQWMDLLGIRGLASASAERLSSGERRRTALARAFAIEPDVLLLDEPLSDMDEEGVGRVKKGLDELAGATVLIASPTGLPEGFCLREHQFT